MPFDVQDDLGNQFTLSADDQRHRAVFNGIWQVGRGFQVSGLHFFAAGLRSANGAGLPSFPARTPRIELDFILVSAGIEVRDFRVPDVRFSDHRPLLCDF